MAAPLEIELEVKVGLGVGEVVRVGEELWGLMVREMETRFSGLTLTHFPQGSGSGSLQVVVVVDNLRLGL